MKADKIRTLKIARLGLSSTTRNRVVEFIFKQRDPNWEVERIRRRRELARLADECTILNFIDACETFLYLYPNHRGGLGWYDVMKKLVKLGLTYLDWNQLPSSTVNTQMLKRLKKEELLQHSILVLNTLSSTATSLLAKHLRKPAAQITIGELLIVKGDGWQGRCHVNRSLNNTRQKLRELGLRHNDGPFLQDGTRRELVESLMEETGVTRKKAALFADVAEKRGWVKHFRPES